MKLGSGGRPRKLDDNKRIEARKMLAAGLTRKEIAYKLGVCHRLICYIVQSKT